MESGKRKSVEVFLYFELMFLTKQQRIDQLFVYRKKNAKWCKFSEEATINSGGMKSGKLPDQISLHSLLFCLCSGFRPRSSRRSHPPPVHALDLL